MAANASELFQEMLSDVSSNHWPRQVGDPQSPAKERTIEAQIGRCYELCNPMFNYVDVRPVDRCWALANVLHFFTGSEYAEPLRRYNKQADRFLESGWWRGAYGAIALCQLQDCIKLLSAFPNSRRAIVSMGGFQSEPTINSPACWSFIHFIQGRVGLDMVVYQRSLSLFGVMPYDCILLSNIHCFVAGQCGIPVGVLRWIVGSVHIKEDETVKHAIGRRHDGMIVPHKLLENNIECMEYLEQSKKLPHPYNEYLHEKATAGTPGVAGQNVL